MSKKKKWLKFRHRAIRWVGLPFMNLYTRLRYRIRVQKHKEKRPYFIMMNHQTAFDQFFVEMAFSGPVYYVASEDLFSKGWISSVIRYVVAPIPIKKQVTDVNAVMNCIRVAREGGTIAIAPEGNRTYSGRTEYMNPAIAPLAKKLKLPIALFRIEGGYGVHPRWSDVVRKGKMRAYVSRVIEPEEYAAMSQTETEQYNVAYEALIHDADAMHAYNMVINLSMVITSIGILLAVLLWEFFVPLWIGNGQTLGKKIFSLCLVRNDGVKLNNMQLFARTILGKYALEIMIPVFIVLMLFWGTAGLGGTVILFALALAQLLCVAISRTNSAIHDFLAGAVVVDITSQMIFRTTEDLIAYKKRIAAEQAARQVY